MSSNKKKSKNTRNLLLLGVVTVLLVVSYVLLVKHNDKKAADEAAAADEETATFAITQEEEEADITGLSIQSADANIVLTLSEDSWILQGEESFPVDNNTVTELVSAMSSLRASKTVTETPEDLSEYGLSEPSIKVTATKSDGTELILEIGDKMSVDTDYYGKLGDSDTVYVLPLATRTKFAITKDSLFAMPDIPTLSYNQLREVQLSSKLYSNFHVAYDAANPYDYTGVGTYSWYEVDNDHLPVNLDNTTYSTLLSKYISYDVTKGVGYGQDAMAQYGLSDQSTMLYVRYEDSDGTEKEFTMYVGTTDENGNYYVSFDKEDRVYLMTADTMSDRLSAEVSDYISKYMHLVNIDSLDQLTVTTAGESHQYLADSETTTDADGNETTTITYLKDGTAYEDETAFKTFYQKAISLKQSGVLSYSDTVSGSSVLTITFELTDGDVVTAEYYEYNDTEYAVKMNGKLRFTSSREEVDGFIAAISES